MKNKIVLFVIYMEIKASANYVQNGEENKTKIERCENYVYQCLTTN
jgi:hypothetical protein